MPTQNPATRNFAHQRARGGALLAMLRRIAPAIGLFFLAPLTAEYLIGYLEAIGNAMAILTGLLILGPMYGGAALIIREVTRRTGRGWPTMILLAFAFGVLQSALVDHSLFNPSYMGIEWWQEARAPTHIPSLGISGYYTLIFVLGHVVGSISAPIAVVEACVPHRRTKPWLRVPGLIVTVILYLLASALIATSMVVEEQFLPSVPQLVGAAVAVIAFIIAAFMIGTQPRMAVDRPAPGPWLAGAIAFATLSLPSLIELLLDLLGITTTFVVDWRGVALVSVLYSILAVAIMRWSRYRGWGPQHILALASGALLTRAWIAFTVEPIGAVALRDKLISNSIFLIGTIMLLALAAHALQRGRGV